MEQGVMIVRTLLSLGAVLLIIFALSWLSKRFLKQWPSLNTPTQNFKILQTYLLEPRKKLLVVNVEGQKILLGVSDHSISYLCSLGERMAFPEKNKMESTVL